MKYLIVGNGVAGTVAAANIRKIDSEGEITIISDEAYPFYSRIRLIEFLSGDVDENGIVIRNDDWYEKNKIRLILNTAVTDIEDEKKEIITHSGGRIKYDCLLLAAGSRCFMPPIAGADRDGVFTLRTLKDAIAIREYAKANRRVILIGGGVLGLEAGNALRKVGNSVMVVEFFSQLLPRQLDAQGAEMLKSQMENMGFRFYLGVKSKEIIGDTKAKALILEDGRQIDCDMMIVSAGIRPNTSLAQKLGLKLGKGLIVNDRMETGQEGIYAAGDLIEHNGVFYGIWHAAEKQGEIAGINMAGGTAIYTGTAISNTLKVAGINLVSAGDIDPEGKYESMVLNDNANFIYKKLVIKDSSIAGAILYGDVKDKMKILKAIDSKKDISSVRNELGEWNLTSL